MSQRLKRQEYLIEHCFGRLKGQPLSLRPIVTSGVWAEFLSVQISPATRRSYAAALKDFFQRELQIEVSVTAIEQLIDGIDRSTSMGKRDYAMLRLLWDNALRRAEVCGLDRRVASRKLRADFHPGEARLYLKGKGRIDKEPIDLATDTVEAISDWLASMGESRSPAL